MYYNYYIGCAKCWTVDGLVNVAKGGMTKTVTELIKDQSRCGVD